MTWLRRRNPKDLEDRLNKAKQLERQAEDIVKRVDKLKAARTVLTVRAGKGEARGQG